MGDNGCGIKVTRMGHPEVFYIDTNGVRTFHVDPSHCTECNSTTTAAEFFQYFKKARSDNQTLNTTLYEIGQMYWHKRVDIHIQDYHYLYYPYIKDYVFNDFTEAYFKRFEYTSSARDREQISGMSYGDENLEKILDIYAQSEVEREFISHPETGGNTIYVNTGEMVYFNIRGKAGSGIQSIWYYNISAPVQLSPNSLYNFKQISFDPDETPVKIKTMKCRLRFNTPGKYVYNFNCYSQLYPIPAQKQQSETGTFTIYVQ